MSKKMKIPSIFKNKLDAKQPWQWPSCNHPKTLSFRASNEGTDGVFKTVNSVFLEADTPESLFTNSSECPSFSTDEFSEENINNGSGVESLETIIRGLKSSERLFFEPGDTSSILKEDKGKSCSKSNGRGVNLAFKESVALALESDDPYKDFKKSMEEMVESNGLKDWDCLEELLGWYLRMNGKMNHRFIVGAFVDMLIGIASNSSSSSSSISLLPSPMSKTMCCSSDSTTSYSSAPSSFSSPNSSPLSTTVILGQEMEIDHHERDHLPKS